MPTGILARRGVESSLLEDGGRTSGAGKPQTVQRVVQQYNMIHKHGQRSSLSLMISAITPSCRRHEAHTMAVLVQEFRAIIPSTDKDLLPYYFP